METRLGTTVGCFMALTAFQFVINDALPAVPYLTPFHTFVIFGYIGLFVSGIEDIVCNHIAREMRLEEKGESCK